MTIDVVSVTFNSRPFLERLLESLPTRDGQVDVIVVDNASTDGTAGSPALVETGTKVIANERNRGLSVALNQGARAGKNEILAFVNPDCVFLSDDWPQVVDKYFHDNPDVAVAAPRLVDEDGSLQYSCHPHRSARWAIASALALPGLAAKLGRPPDWRWRPEWPRDDVRDVDVVSGACMFVRRSDFLELGGFDEQFFLYFEEDDLCLRATQRQRRVVNLGTVQVMHSWAHSTRGVQPEVTADHIQRSFVLYFEKHRGRGFGFVLRCLISLRRRAGRLARRIVSLRRAS